MMWMDLMDDCKISHLEVHCLGKILCEVDLPKAIERGGRPVQILDPNRVRKLLGIWGGGRGGGG